MTIEDLPGEMIFPSRDKIRDDYLRDYRLRNPTASTIENTEPYVDASVTADSQVPVYANAKALGDFAAGKNRRGAALDNDAKRLGTARLPATGGSGFLLVAGSSTGGGTILQGDECRALTAGGLRYQAMATAAYVNGDAVGIIGIDTGPSTNLPAGTILTWTSPRPGINPRMAVVEQSDGSGLTNGRNVESDQDLDARLIELRANPPAAGNDAEFQETAEQTPGIFPQKAFTYPAILGPGTMGVCALLRPASAGANRIPSAAQNAAVNAWLVGQFPGDDSISVCSTIASAVTLAIGVTWAAGAVGWLDTTPWPTYQSSMVVVNATATPTPTSFYLSSAGSPGNPQVGQTLAFYDAPNQVFRKKKILTVTGGSSPWLITVDTTNNVSDVAFTPIVGQPVCPWSDSLDSTVAAIVSVFDGLGPGEQVASFFDPGLRQRRQPRSPTAWPSVISRKSLIGVEELTTVESITPRFPTLPYVTPVGTPGVSSNLLTLGYIALFPE